MATVRKSNINSKVKSKAKAKRAPRASKSKGNSSLGLIAAGAVGALLGWMA